MLFRSLILIISSYYLLALDKCYIFIIDLLHICYKQDSNTRTLIIIQVIIGNLRLLVIGLSGNDPVAPVHLLQQYHPHQLMGKRHLREAKLIVGAA